MVLAFGQNDLNSQSIGRIGKSSTLRVLQAGDIDITLHIASEKNMVYTKTVFIKMFDFNAKIHFGENRIVKSIELDNYEWRPNQKFTAISDQSQLIPSIGFYKIVEFKERKTLFSSDLFIEEFLKKLKLYAHGNTSDKSIRKIAHGFGLGTRYKIFEHLQSYENTLTLSKNILQGLGRESPHFKELCDTFFATQLDLIIDYSNNALNNILSQVIYLEPLRATAQRYYRKQSMSIEEIDSKGENIAMFLDSLDDSEKERLNTWLMKHFDISAHAKRDGGHISIMVKGNNQINETNIADMGFGFSQMIPIATQIWASSTIRSLRPIHLEKHLHPIMVIEQPELHLHPGYQAKLADMFVARLKNDKNINYLKIQQNIRFIIETHSQSLVNRFGHLVANGEINRNDIQVLLFNQDESGYITKIIVSEFDEDGTLTNWPFGFFEPSGD